MNFAYTVFITLRMVIMQFANIRASKVIHELMIVKVLKAPINLFFDVTPIGRILNRFSKDMQVLDNEMGWTLGYLMTIIYMGISTLAVAAVAVYWILIPLPLILYGFYKLFVFSIHS